MLFQSKSDHAKNMEEQALLNALDSVQAMIWFDTKGNILKANENFLKTVGYTSEEIVGNHHRMFVFPELAESSEYAEFWDNLREGKTSSGKYKRRAKDGSVLWLEASYNPIFDAKGNVTGFVKFAIDITQAKLSAADRESRLKAVSRAFAVIEFDLEATILKANDNFCDTMGYSESEIVGQKHSMFVDPEYGQSREYEDFWNKLRAGEFVSSEFPRIGKNGDIVWIQASYNPILNTEGKPYKVVKYATDISERRNFISTLQENITRLASGDLSPRMTEVEGSEFNPLSIAFNETMVRLASLTDDIKDTSHAVSDGMRNISSGAAELSERTEQQAASLEETNAAIEDISSNISTTASSAKNASEAAKDAEKRAVQGDSVVGEAIAAMERIEEGSQKISAIINVIESISFQTNLLALNAAVEAARAGESGKGFAVVASEVRTLAQRSSEAAQDITDLIESSSTQVLEGAKLVRNTGDMLGEIKSSIDAMVKNVEEITGSSFEQANGIREISSVVSGIDANTQSNAQLAHQSASDAQALASKSDHLLELAAFFGSDKKDTLSAGQMMNSTAPMAHSA